MARTSKLEFSVGRTVNLGNYNSFRFDLRITKDLDEGDNPEQVYDELVSEVNEKAQAYLDKMGIKEKK